MHMETRTLKQIQSAQTRQQIVETATRLFACKGFFGTSIATLAQACGLTKGALYHHIKNKEAIFYAVVESVRGLWERGVAREVSRGKGALDQLRTPLDSHTRLLSENEMLCLVMSNLMLEMENVNPEYAKILQRVYEDLTLFIERIVQEGQAAAAIRSDVDPLQSHAQPDGFRPHGDDRDLEADSYRRAASLRFFFREYIPYVWYRRRSMEKFIVAILPLAFLVHLRVSEVVMARQSIAFGGHPPIESWLFHAGKYLSIGVWIGMALQSWGIGFFGQADPNMPAQADATEAQEGDVRRPGPDHDRRDSLYPQSRDPGAGSIRHRGPPQDHPRRGTLAAGHLRAGLRGLPAYLTPSRNQISMDPLPFTSIQPCGSHKNSSLISS